VPAFSPVPNFCRIPAVYSLHAIRLLIQFLIVAAVAFGVISSLLRKKKTLALAGMLLAIAGNSVGRLKRKVNGSQLNGMTIGMDWFYLIVIDGSDLRTAGKTLATISRNKEPSEKGGPRTWFISCPLICRSRFCLFSFCCPPPSHQIFGCSRSPATYCSNALAFGSFFWPSWSRTLPNILFIWLCTKCRFYGDFTPVTISSKALDWIAGSRSTLWTTHLSADLSLFR